MHKCLVQSSPQQEVDVGNSTTNTLYLSHCIFHNFSNLGDITVQNCGAPEMGDVSTESVWIWLHPSSKMFRRYVNHLLLNCHCPAPNHVQRGVYARPLLNWMIQLWSSLVLVRVAYQSGCWLAGYIVMPVKCGVRSEMDAKNSILLSTCNACNIIQLHCHTLFPSHFPHQLPPYLPLTWLDQGYMSDQFSGGLWFLCQKYLLVVVFKVHNLRVDY